MYFTFKVSKSRLLNSFVVVLLAVAFKLSLDFASFHIINGAFGSTLVFDFEFIRFLESYLLLVFSSFFIAYIYFDSQNPSGIVYFSYYLFLIVPLLVIYGLRDGITSRPFSYMIIFSFFISIVVSQYLPRVKLPRAGSGVRQGSIFLFVVLSVYVYASLIVTGGLSRFNLDLYKVYEVRNKLDFSVLLFGGYLIPWQAHVINMFLLVLGLIKRSKIIVSCIFISQIILFGMTNFKSFLLAPFFVILIYFFSRRKNFFALMLLGATVTILVSVIIFLSTGEIMMPSIMIRRLYLVPADIHFWYYDFFSKLENPHIFLSNSILSPFFCYQYDVPITRVISWEYLNRDGGPNVGYLADAYAHFGFGGMIFFSFILGIFLNILDSVVRDSPTNASAAIIAVPAMALVNSGLFTTFLTHGLLLGFFFVWLSVGISRGSPLRHKD